MTDRTTTAPYSPKNEETRVFSQNLAKAIISTGRMNIDIAHEVGISDSTLGGYIAGLAAPRLDVAVRLANAIGVSLDALTGRREDGAADLQAAADTLHIGYTAAYRIASTCHDEVDVLLSSEHFEDVFTQLNVALRVASNEAPVNPPTKDAVSDALWTVQKAGYVPVAKEGAVTLGIQQAANALVKIFKEECDARMQEHSSTNSTK